MAALYYSIVQAQRYFNNDDMSKVSFRLFNQINEDKYPDITFCLEGNHLKDSTEEFQVSPTTVSDIMKGKVFFNEQDQNMSRQIIESKSDELFIDLSEVLLSFSFTTNYNDTAYSKQMVKSDNPQRKINSVFHTTYLDPDKVCFTRNSRLEIGTGALRKHDEIVFDVSQMIEKINLKIFLHYPERFIRTIERPVTEIVMSRYHIPEQITLSISDVTILRRRNKPSDPCDERNVDYDQEFRTQVMKAVKCRPSYWSDLPISESDDWDSIPLCRTSEELNNVYKHITNFSKIISNELLPCTEMAISCTITNKQIEYHDSEYIPPGRMYILVRYSTLQYQHIINVQDFDFDSMFSAIGGFVGIFLGYSLLQATDIIEMTVFRNLRSCCTHIISLLYCLSNFFFRKGKKVLRRGVLSQLI